MSPTWTSLRRSFMRRVSRRIWRPRFPSSLLSNSMEEVCFIEESCMWLAGHINHSIFWTNLAPAKEGGAEGPKGVLLSEIKKEFGSFEDFKTKFNTAAASVQGLDLLSEMHRDWHSKDLDGLGSVTTRLQSVLKLSHSLTKILWRVLVSYYYSHLDLTCSSRSVVGSRCMGTRRIDPFLLMSANIQAYYLQYKNVRPDYLKAIWNVINWKNVAERAAAVGMK